MNRAAPVSRAGSSERRTECPSTVRLVDSALTPAPVVLSGTEPACRSGTEPACRSGTEPVLPFRHGAGLGGRSLVTLDEVKYIRGNPRFAQRP